ncbi:MAG: sulfide-dependent adenosine diphosphate thiazole synthase [bacterium]
MAIFDRASEGDVTEAIVTEFATEMVRHIRNEAVIIGAGPSGLVAARELALNGVQVLVVENNNYLGGGFWLGGFLMNKVTVRAPGQEVLEEIGCPVKKMSDGLYVADGPHACSKLIAAACDAGVKFLNMTRFDDIVLRNNRVEGAVINWTPISALPRNITCVDPISIEAKILVDATGHDAVVSQSLARRNLIEIAGMGAMDVEGSEDLIVEKTGEVYPGLMACGMAVSTICGLPRMGPTFGGMLLSGKKTAVQISEALLAVA